MATTTRKRTTPVKSKDPVLQEETNNIESKVRDTRVKAKMLDENTFVPKEAPAKQRRVFNDTDGIPCRSITQGGLFMEGAKTHMLYEWVDYGDITHVEYADLAAAVRVKSSYVFGPLFIVDDDDFVNEFLQLKKFYTDNYTVNDLEKILSYPVEKMLAEISALPKSAIESMKVLAASSINEGNLDSVKKIKALDDVFGTNLSLLAEFKN